MLDILIKNAHVFDGVGNKLEKKDVAIKNGLIYEIGLLPDEKARRVIDARGLIVSPGFIDVLNHSDTHWRLFHADTMASLLHQGITSIIGGNCGTSLAPIAHHKDLSGVLSRWSPKGDIILDWHGVGEFLARVEAVELPLNYGTLIGQGIVRRNVLRDEKRSVDASDMQRLKNLYQQSIQEGGLGISHGQAFSSERGIADNEIEMMAEICRENNTLMTFHLPDESQDGIRRSFEQLLTWVKKYTFRAHISHFKVVDGDGSLMRRFLDRLDVEGENGVDISFDAYPYTSTGSLLSSLLPEWVVQGGRSLMLGRLRSLESRTEMLIWMQKKNIDFSRIHLLRSGLSRGIASRGVQDMAQRLGKRPEEIVADTIISSEGRASAIMEILSQDAVDAAVTNKRSILSTNGAGYAESDRREEGVAHPRSFGALPKFLREYVREKKMLTWEEALYKVTGFPAQRFHIHNRGLIQEGAFADIVIFDPEKITDIATTQNPYRYAQGMKYVIVNGEIALENEQVTLGKFGQIIRHT